MNKTNKTYEIHTLIFSSLLSNLILESIISEKKTTN